MKYTVLLLAGLLILAGCGDGIKPGQTEESQPVISDLATATVETGKAALQRSLNGTIEAPDQSRLMARLPGRVAKILIHEGQTAKAGAAILILDQQTATDEMDAAQSAVDAAAGNLAEAETRQQLTSRTLQRYQQLKEGEAVTGQEFDQVKNEDEAARQKVLSAQANLSRARSSLQAARVLAAQVKVAAPFDARINRILVDAGSTVMPGTPLVQFDRIGPWQVSLNVPESLVDQFRPGSEYDVEIPSAGLRLKGVLARIYPAADPVTRTLTVKLALPEGTTLNSGLFAKIYIPTAGLESLFVPSSAIVTRGQLTSVYVVADGTLHYRLVRIGKTLDDQTEILSGLSPGETIVTEGAARARHGARVEN